MSGIGERPHIRVQIYCVATGYVIVVSGETYRVCDTLKALGFMPTKKDWVLKGNIDIDSVLMKLEDVADVDIVRRPTSWELIRW